MEILRKVLKVVMVLFIISIVMIGIMMWRDIDPGEEFFKIFMPAFFIILASFFIIGGILSFSSIIKYAKKDPKRLMKSFLLRFLVLMTISFGTDYLKSKQIDIGYGFAYSLIITIGSFYMQDRFIEE